MNIEQILLYSSVIFAISIVPGPSMVFAFTQGISHKLQGVIPAALGNVFASLTQAMIAYLAFKSFISINDYFLLIIQLFGAAYISYIGYIFIRYSDQFSLRDDQINTYKIGLFARFKTGFLIAFFNPKAILFFIAIFPQFISNTNMGISAEVLYIFMPIASIAFICFMIYGFFGSASIKFFTNKDLIKYLIQILGVLLIISSVLALLKLAFGISF